MRRLPTIRRVFVLPALAALSASALLAGCSSAANPSTNNVTATTSSSSASSASSASSTSAAYPTADVVSAVAENPSLHAALLAADPGAASGLTLGTTDATGLTTLPHVGLNSAGQTVGADVDLRNALAKILGTSWNVQNGTFDAIIPGVQNGRFTVGQDNYGVTSAREKIVDFVTYVTDGQGLLAPSDSTLSHVTSITQLCGLTIGTGAGTTFQTILQTDASKCAAAGKAPYKVQYFSDNAAIWLGLGNGRLDAYFSSAVNLAYDAGTVPNVKFVGQISSTSVGFVLAKGSPISAVLAKAVNELIADGEYRKILQKWSIAGNGITTSQVNPKPSL
jgi:polar amino acid transport system substrate-binding protein